VLHAVFYYIADNMKARFCRDGNRQLTEYFLDRGLPINRCGKLVVAANESEQAGLDELIRRGRLNAVSLAFTCSMPFSFHVVKQIEQ
jgi:L-2-hydroxyglutarate oxidase